MIGSIEEEAAACRDAFRGVEVGALVWHCHHDRLIEVLTEPAEKRIEYILAEKAEHEQALRLHLFRPVRHVFESAAYAEWRKADVEWRKAYAEWQKADAELLKADAELLKADAELLKADAEWRKADVEWRKAYAELLKADAEWRKADVEWRKAYAEWRKADADEIMAAHAQECPDCPWDGISIVGDN